MSPYYAQIVRDYPLSPLVQDSKKHLVALQAAVPEPNPLRSIVRSSVQDEGKGVFGVLDGFVQRRWSGGDFQGYQSGFGQGSKERTLHP